MRARSMLWNTPDGLAVALDVVAAVADRGYTRFTDSM